MLGQRPGQTGDADQPGVGRDEQDRGREDADVVAGDAQHGAVQPESRDDAEHGVVFVRRAEFGDVVAAVVHHRQRGQRDDRDAGVHAEHGDQHEVDGLGYVVAGVLGLLGHVGDRLDPGVGDHRDRQREDQLRPGRRHSEMDLVDEQRRVQDEHEPEPDQQDLRAEVGDGEEQVEFGRLAETADVQRGEQHDRDQPADDVARVVGEAAGRTRRGSGARRTPRWRS